MMKYERLTIRNSDGSVSQPTNSTIEKVFNRLAEFEDKIEKGIDDLTMKYKIEIWQYHAVVDKYESKTIEDIKYWFYNSNWKWIYELCGCCFYVYEHETEMSFEELNKYGFYD